MVETSSQQKVRGLKILTPKQVVQRQPIALEQIKAGKNSESLLNEIRHILYSLYHFKEITKKYITIKLNQQKYNRKRILSL